MKFLLSVILITTISTCSGYALDYFPTDVGNEYHYKGETIVENQVQKVKKVITVRNPVTESKTGEKSYIQDEDVTLMGRTMVTRKSFMVNKKGIYQTGESENPETLDLVSYSKPNLIIPIPLREGRYWSNFRQLKDRKFSMNSKLEKIMVKLKIGENDGKCRTGGFSHCGSSNQNVREIRR